MKVSPCVISKATSSVGFVVPELNSANCWRLLRPKLNQFVNIIDSGHRSNGKAAKMRIDRNRLRIRITNDTNAQITSEFTNFIAEFRPEIGIFDVVNGTMKKIALARHHAGTLCAKVRMVINAIEQVRRTRFLRDNAKKATHKLL